MIEFQMDKEWKLLFYYLLWLPDVLCHHWLKWTAIIKWQLARLIRLGLIRMKTRNNLGRIILRKNTDVHSMTNPGPVTLFWREKWLYLKTQKALIRRIICLASSQRAISPWESTNQTQPLILPFYTRSFEPVLNGQWLDTWWTSWHTWLSNDTWN